MSSYGYDALDRTVAKGVTLTSPAGEVTVNTEQRAYAGVTEELVRTSLHSESPAAVIDAGTKYSYAAGAAVGLGPH